MTPSPATSTRTCAAEPEVEIVDPPSLSFEGIDVYTCPDCGTFVSDADYDETQYDEDYYTIADQSPESIEDRWGFRWRYVLDQIMALAPTTTSVLDVGAGNGLFVKLAAEDYGLDATGLEISQASVDFARTTLDVELLAEDLRDHTGLYDVVTAFSVVEHVPEPRAMVHTMASHLQPGGLLVLATPNPGCIQRRVKGVEGWGMVCPPHHLNVFTRVGLERMVADAGLTPLRWEAISTSVKAVRRFDTKNELLRRAISSALRVTSLGADQLLFARMPEDG